MTIQLLEVVALVNDLPDHNLIRGQVGTVVEQLGPEVYEVEFTDEDGRAYASLALPGDKLLALHYHPVAA